MKKVLNYAIFLVLAVIVFTLAANVEACRIIGEKRYEGTVIRPVYYFIKEVNRPNKILGI